MTAERQIKPKPNPHELDRFSGVDMGANKYGQPLQEGRNVPMIEIFSRAQINRLDQLRKEVQWGKIDAPNRIINPTPFTTIRHESSS